MQYPCSLKVQSQISSETQDNLLTVSSYLKKKKKLHICDQQWHDTESPYHPQGWNEDIAKIGQSNTEI